MRTPLLVILILTSGCPDRAIEPNVPIARTDPRFLHREMQAHFDSAHDLQRAITDGRLSDMRDVARNLATMNPELGQAGDPNRVQLVALAVSHAASVTEGAAQMGRLGRACSSCHEAEATRVELRFPAAPPAPPDGPTLTAQMDRHRWAAERLWDGVIVPADQPWFDGASVMATTALDLTTTINGKPNEEVFELASGLRRLALDARDVHDPDARSALYSAMLVTCASCHAIVRSRPISVNSSR